MQQPEKSLKRELGLLDATLLVVGSMIGSGIFIVSAGIAKNVGSAGWLIAIWVLSALITIIAAVSYGELSAMYPQAGGQYIYLKEAYNKMIAFLYGWSIFSVIQTGTIAAVGVGFAKFAAYLFPAIGEDKIWIDLGFLQISAAQIVAIISLIILTFINASGVKNGKLIQKIFTFTKLFSLFGLLLLGFVLAADAEVWNNNWADAWNAQQWIGSNNWQTIGGTVLITAIASSMVGSLFSSDGWYGVTFISGEIKNPQRNVGLSLFLGTLLVSIIYITFNLMYVAVIPMNEIANAPFERVAEVASTKMFGPTGTLIIAIMIMISTFGCNNGLIMSGSRCYYTMAQDGLFFKKAALLNKNNVPGWGLWIQCLWASLLCLTGKYGDLLDFVMIIVIIFYILTIAGIFILRIKQPQLERPYKAFGYPIVPALYIVAATALCVALLITKTSTCGWGVVIMFAGIPVYYFYEKKNKNDR